MMLKLRPAIGEMVNWRTILMLAVAGFCLAACTEDAPPPTEPNLEPVTLEASTATPPLPTLPATVPPSTEVIVERVEGLMVSRPNEQPDTLIILASGLVGSRGWSRPRLVPAGPDEASNTISLNFVATSPEREMPSGVRQPIEALLEFSPFPDGVEMVRVIGATNELTALVNN